MTTAPATRTDIYSQVTNRIVAELERGVRPWFKPWNAEHAAGRITRPLRHNGTPYQGINILMLWASAEMAGYALTVTFQSVGQELVLYEPLEVAVNELQVQVEAELQAEAEVEVEIDNEGQGELNDQ